MVTAEVTTEVISLAADGRLPFFDLLVFALGVMAITFIAIIFFLDLKTEQEPLRLPEKET